MTWATIVIFAAFLFEAVAVIAMSRMLRASHGRERTLRNGVDGLIETHEKEITALRGLIAEQSRALDLYRTLHPSAIGFAS